jgi:uracil-DNA glycosylase family 4
MHMNTIKLISIYTKICECASEKCKNFEEIYNCPSKGSPPRGFYTTATETVEVMVVGKNPGHVLESEANTYINLYGEDLVKAHWEFSKKTFNKLAELSRNDRRSTTFHSNLLAYLSEILEVSRDVVFNKVAYTNLVKCSTNGDEQANLTKRSIDECFTNHLKTEIDFFKPKVIFALGREVESYLRKQEILKQYPIAYIKHPSYHYRKELREAKIAELRATYRNFC